jgi:prepilin-type N-terminal cleavage/methylation domain-containing protein
MQRGFAMQRGFTMVEMMVIVVIVGVLATLGTFGLIKYVRSARTSEALAMIVDIKGAEEVARDETFLYVGLEQFSSWHPTDPPREEKADWNADTGPASGIFRRLGVISAGPVYFTYSVIAGTSVAPPQMPFERVLGFPSSPSGPYYVAVARGDLDGDGENSFVVGHSFGSDLYVEKEGE